jgi:hypothetical protein
MVRAMILGQCNMLQTYALVDDQAGVKTPQCSFSVDEMAINRSM